MFTLAADISTAETDYGVVLLDQKSGAYWNLNPTGALVLRTVLGGGGLDGAVAALVREYQVEKEIAVEDVREVVGSLVQAKILVPPQEARA